MKQSIRGKTMRVMVLPLLAVSAPVMAAAPAKADAAKARAEAATKAEPARNRDGDKARDAAEKVKVDYETLPAAVDTATTQNAGQSSSALVVA